MPIFKKKSEDNLTAARLLCDKTLYYPSVHCAYYSSFQLMKFVLKDFFSIDYIAQEKELAEKKKTKASSGMGVHVYTIEKFQSLSQGKIDRIVLQKLIRNIKDLKQFREKSDYQETIISLSETIKVIDKSDDVFQTMNKIFI